MLLEILRRRSCAAATVALAAAALATPAPCDPASEAPVEATSLLGQPLARPALESEFEKRQRELLAAAEAQLERRPDDVDSWIWVGRRLGYLARYREAIAHYSAALARFPDDPRLLRHRGHRYISVRHLDEATNDLRRAADRLASRSDEVEPDGLPNQAGVPTSTLQSNVWYHLGLTHYLSGRYDQAADAYRECLRFSTNSDMRVATTYWLYLTLERLGRSEEAARELAPIYPEMHLFENHSYHRLLLAAQGKTGLDELLATARSEQGTIGFPTTAYGVATLTAIHGDVERAERLLREIVDTAPQWSAFGYIAAEADLARDDGEPTAR